MKRLWSRRALLYALATGAWIMAFDLAADLLDFWHQRFGELHALLATCTVLFLYALLGWGLRRREQAEQDLQHARDELEVRVRERTAELIQANEALQAEMAERVRVDKERERLMVQIKQDREAIQELAGVLSRERDTLETIMENTRTCLAYLDSDLNFVRVNSAYVESSGHNREDLIGRNHFELFPNAENQAIFEKVREAGQPVEFHAKPFEYADQPDRGVTYWDWGLAPVKDGSGRVLGLVLSLLDVTQAERGKQDLQGALELSHQRQTEVTALLEGARAVLAFRGFEDAARSLLDACKNLVKANAGCIALLSADGIENEVLWSAMDLGGRPCTLDSKLPTPTRGLREEACQSGRTVCSNHLPSSDEAIPAHLCAAHELPMDLENALFAPLQIRGITVGLMGLVNKPGGFTENDVHMASAFSELAAIALFNSRTMESLENSERRFRSVAQTANEAIVTVDSQSNVVFWNQAAETMFGYTGEEIIGQPFTLIMTHRFRAACENGIRYALATGKSELIGKVIEAVGLGKDGSEFPIEHSFAAWRTREGAFFTGVIHDITDRKRAELALREAHQELEARVQERTAQLAQINEVLQAEIAERTQTEKELRASEERFRQLAENLREIFWMADAQTARMLYVSPAYEEIWRRSCQSLYEQTTSFLDAVHPEDRERMRANLERQMHGDYDEQYRIVRSDGSMRWIRTRAFPIRDEKGEVYRIAGISEDITERALAFQLMEQRVEERTRELSMLLEASRSMASTLNMDQLLGLILDQLGAVVECCSASMYTMEGQELWAVAYRGPLPQKTTVGLRIPLDSLAAHTKTVLQRAPLVISDVRGDSMLAGDFRASVGKLMETRFADIRCWMGVPLVIQERVIGLLCLHHDQADYYTSRHAELAMAFASQAALALDNARLYQQAQELAAIQERQRLARDLHDSVSQTLFSASLSAGVLPRLWERDPETGRFCLEELRQLTRGALAEMRTLLLELRPTALVETKLDELLRQLADAFTSRTRVPVTLTVEGQGLLPPNVQVTMYRIAQEALNNAAKHAGANQMWVSLRYLEQDRNSGELVPRDPKGRRACAEPRGTRKVGVELCISDDGQGFDLEDVSAEHLGLSIMRERAEAVGASLEIESQVGQGTRLSMVWTDQTNDD